MTLNSIHIAEGLLAIVITTSPIPSIPSTEFIEEAIASLPNCTKYTHLIIHFDGFKVATQTFDSQGRLKKGVVPESLAARYPEYIDRVKLLFGGNTSGEELLHESFVSTCQNPESRQVTFVRSKFHRGFANSVRAALLFAPATHILVLQHDWVFCQAMTQFVTLLDILQHDQEVEYITFVSRKSLDYVKSKGLSKKNYQTVFNHTKGLRDGRPLATQLVGCLHIYDRPHLCSKLFYDRLFATGLIHKGDFVEDTVGTSYITSISRAASSELATLAWSKYKAWMLMADDPTQALVRHASGRICMTKEEERARVAAYRAGTVSPADVEQL